MIDNVSDTLYTTRVGMLSTPGAEGRPTHERRSGHGAGSGMLWGLQRVIPEAPEGERTQLKMRTGIVFTLTGNDRVGIVEEVTGLLLGLDGNVETSRMARLGGEFAILMLVSLPEEQVDHLSAVFETLQSEGYRVTVTRTETGVVDHAGWRPYILEVNGADHEGIVHEIAQGLSKWGINIESMETGTSRAPVSATTLFHLTASVAVPPGLAEGDWIPAVEEAGHDANVDVKVAPAQES
jgi:glycine cleavage system transcriptional repressor